MAKQKVELVNVDLALPEEVQDVRVLNLRLDKRVIETARKATDELLTSRKLYHKQDPDAITAADPLSLLFMAGNPNLSGADAAYRAGAEYQKFIQEARREAMVIAMTMYTELGDRKPRPYEESVEEDDAPGWLKDSVEIPEPERNLDNRYEERLKIVMDILEDAGILFTARFEEIINNDLGKKLHAMMEDESTDEDGFRPARTRKSVSRRSVSAGGAN